MKFGILARLLLCFLGELGLPAHSQEKDDSVARYESIQQHMGAHFKITIYADQTTAARAIPAAFARIREIDLRLSNYKPQSELSQLPHRSDSSLPVGDDLWDILVLSQKMHRESSGAFDLTVGPITDLWRIARQKKALPDKRAVDEALARMGMRHIELDSTQKTVQLLQENMVLDPGGIAKGWAVQQAVLVLKKHGITSALVDGGGDMFMVGTPRGRDGWRILVAPLRPGGKPSTIITLKNQAVATSGDTWQYLPINGKRYSHIVDPKTGMGVTIPSSVTVIANDGALADAWASAISVLGPEKGLKSIEKHVDIEALIVYLDDDGQVKKKSSPGFERYIVKQE
jgi:FAD:protein FMN transferase